MSSQQPSLDLANMLPGPRFQAGQAPAPPLRRMPSFAQPAPTTAENQALVAEQREARAELRRQKQASPGEGRNARRSGTGEPDSGLISPTRAQTPGPPQLSTVSPEANTDMTRFGLVADPGESPSPTGRPQRRRMSSADRQSPEPRGGLTPSEAGSDAGTPTRRLSKTDMHSSHDSFESLAGGTRASRRGSGFKKGVKAPKAAVKTSVADVHIVGELVGASGFQYPMLFCRWELVYEPTKSWKVVNGKGQGVTHACRSDVGEEDLVVWEHPVDIHMQTQSLQGWPALYLVVYAVDEGNDRESFVSYALVNLPTTPGLHHLSSQTWFALESNRALGRTFFGWHTGLIPRLEDETFIMDLRKREDAGPFICTVAAGEVHLRLSILTKNLDHVTHQGGESLAAALERLNTNILRSAAMEERRRSEDSLTEGQKLVRGGRDDRIASARAALEARRRDGTSPAPSESSRTTSFLDRQGRSSFRFSGVPHPPSHVGGDAASTQDDGRSETSFSGRPRVKDRYAARQARLAQEKEKAEKEKAEKEAASQEGGSASASVLGAEARWHRGAAQQRRRGGGAPPSRASSLSGGPAARSNSGGVERTGSRRGGLGPRLAARQATEEDDGMDTIGGEEAADDDVAARAAAREARRAQQKGAF